MNCYNLKIFLWRIVDISYGILWDHHVFKKSHFEFEKRWIFITPIDNDKNFFANIGRCVFYKNLMKSYVNFGSVYGYHTTKEACPSVIERKVEQSRKKYEGTNGLQYPCLTLIVPARGTTMVHPYAQKKKWGGNTWLESRLPCRCDKFATTDAILGGRSEDIAIGHQDRISMEGFSPIRT